MESATYPTGYMYSTGNAQKQQVHTDSVDARRSIGRRAAAARLVRRRDGAPATLLLLASAAGRLLVKRRETPFCQLGACFGAEPSPPEAFGLACSPLLPFLLLKPTICTHARTGGHGCNDCEAL